MKALLRWLAKVVGTALTLVLIFVMFPYVSKVASLLMPDEAGAAIKASVVIASRMEESARLETLRVEEEGVMNYDIQAAFLGSVGNVNVRYQYQAAFGIDLSKVEMVVTGDEITFRLPVPELIQDSLTPLETYRNDFWYPGFSDDDYNNLLAGERQERRDVYLVGDKAEELHRASQNVFEKTIAAWMKDIKGNIVLKFETITTPAGTE